MKNINVANAVLLVILIMLAANVLPPLVHLEVGYTLPSPKKAAEQESKPPEAKPLLLSEYAVISEENIFHPERKIPVIRPDAPPLPKPDFVLYGTLITDEMSLAYMEDLKAAVTSPTKGRRQRALKKGEAISGFTLKEIEADKVVMVRGEEKIEVRVAERGKSKGTGAGAFSPSTPQGSIPSLLRPAQPSTVSPNTQADDIKKRRESLRTRETRGKTQ